MSGDKARVEAARLGVRRAQEALGVLVAVDGPVDAAADPAFDLPTDTTPVAQLVEARSDLRLVAAREQAALRVLEDSRKDYLPSVRALFDPLVQAPTGLFSPAWSWRATVAVSLPLFDGGQRKGQKREREAVLNGVRAERANAARQATSDVRVAHESIRALERALASAREAAQQASEVLRITDIAFREGATTNIEVIDAQRRARDAETTAAVAEDALRRARLDLLVATGRFPR